MLTCQHLPLRAFLFKVKDGLNTDVERKHEGTKQLFKISVCLSGRKGEEREKAEYWVN